MFGDAKKAMTIVLVGSLLLVAQAVQSDADVVARWDLDDGSGTAVSAYVGSINGTINNNVSWQIAEPPPTHITQMQSPSTHLLFGGTDIDDVNFGSSATLVPAHVRAGFWAKGPAASGKKILLSKFGSWEFGFASNQNLYFRINSGVFAGKDASEPFTLAELNDGQWHYLMGLHDGSKSSLFVDGKLIESLTNTAAINSSTTDLLLGHRDHPTAQEPYNGRIGGPLIIADDGVVVGRWDIDDGTGATQLSPEVGSIYGDLENDVTWQSGGPPKEARPAHAVKFNGGYTDDINLGDDSALNPANITVAFWAKADGDHSRDVLLSKWDTVASDQSSYEFGFDGSGYLFWRTYNGSTEKKAGLTAADKFTTTEFDDGQWHHIVGTYDGSLSKLYVDGELIESLTHVGDLDDSGGITPLLLGRRPYTVNDGGKAPYDGWIGGPVLIFDRALSAGEVGFLSQVPEPSTMTMLVSAGLCALVLGIRRRKMR